MNRNSVEIRKRKRNRFSSFIRNCLFFSLLVFLPEKSCNANDEFFSKMEKSFFPFKISLGFAANLKRNLSNEGYQKDYFEGAVFLKLKEASFENIGRKYYNFGIFITEDLESSVISDPLLDKLKKEDLNGFIEKEYKSYRKLLGFLR